MFDQAKANIPMNLWNINFEHDKWPGTSESKIQVEEYLGNIEERYLECQNFFLLDSGRQDRQYVMAGMAQRIGFSPNRYYRFTNEPKHRDAVPEETAPGFQVSMMDPKDLELSYKENEETFRERITVPDFLFLVELGSEFPNTFTARILTDALYTREAAGLPVVVSLRRRPSEVLDKNGTKVYLELADIIKNWKRARL